MENPTSQDKSRVEENKQREVNTLRQLRDRGRLRAPQRYENEVNFAVCKTLETFREAVEGPDSTKWVKAISEELQAHKKNNTWTLVKKHDNMRLIDTKCSKSWEAKRTTQKDIKQGCALEVFFNSMDLTTTKRSLLLLCDTILSGCFWLM